MNLATLKPIPWETRNLGIPSFAVCSTLATATDAIDTGESQLAAQLGAGIAAVRREHARFFIQARTEPGDGLIPLLHELGFHCAETSLMPHCNLARNALLPRYEADPAAFLPARYAAADFGSETVDKSDEMLRMQLCELARRAFTGDRFHLDAHCDPAIADARYALWMNDLWAEQAVSITAFRFRGAIAGFLARRGNALVLAGFDRAYSHRGWGDYFWLGIMQKLRDEGFASSHTNISASNVAVLNLYARLGWKFRSPRLTFHLWGSG